MDRLFKALNDPARRALLDSLRQRDGQSLSELEEQLSMTRFGVMKHLKVLEEAQLIFPRRQGRFKYHYLNALPLQEMLDRWVAPFLQPQARALSDLKSRLEQESALGAPDFMMQTFIRASEDALWSALTEADQIAAYHVLSTDVRGDLRPGAATRFLAADGSEVLRHVTTALDPKTRIAMTFEPRFPGQDAPASHMVYRVAPQGESCKLTLEHYDIAPGQEDLAEGWARHLASLKSYLETGTPLRAAM